MIKRNYVVAAGLAAGLAFVITGCSGDEDTSTKSISELKGKEFFIDARTANLFSVEERNMYLSYRNISTSPYSGLLHDVVLTRDKDRKDGVTSQYFFCGSEMSLKIDDAASQASNGKLPTLSAYIKEVSGKSVDQWCEAYHKERGTKNTVTFSVNPTAVAATRVNIETLKLLTEAVKTCNRAKVDVINSTTDLSALTQEAAEKIIAQCAVFNLEKELNN